MLHLQPYSRSVCLCLTPLQHVRSSPGRSRQPVPLPSPLQHHIGRGRKRRFTHVTKRPMSNLFHWKSAKRAKVLPDSHVWVYTDGRGKEQHCHILRSGLGGSNLDDLYCEILVRNTNKILVVNKNRLRWLDEEQDNMRSSQQHKAPPYYNTRASAPGSAPAAGPPAIIRGVESGNVQNPIPKSVFRIS